VDCFAHPQHCSGGQAARAVFIYTHQGVIFLPVSPMPSMSTASI